jgi:hypothetical protein
MQMVRAFLSALSGLENARSVPCCRVTRYCSGVSCFSTRRPISRPWPCDCCRCPFPRLAESCPPQHWVRCRTGHRSLIVRSDGSFAARAYLIPPKSFDVPSQVFADQVIGKRKQSARGFDLYPSEDNDEERRNSQDQYGNTSCLLKSTSIKIQRNQLSDPICRS